MRCFSYPPRGEAERGVVVGDDDGGLIVRLLYFAGHSHILENHFGSREICFTSTTSVLTPNSSSFNLSMS